jgi:hypothetical protein
MVANLARRRQARSRFIHETQSMNFHPRGVISSGLRVLVVPPNPEGAGKTGCRRHPLLTVCEGELQKMHTDLTGTARTSRPSPRDGFTAYTRSPRGTAFLAPVAAPPRGGADRRQGRGARTTRLRRTRLSFVRRRTSSPFGTEPSRLREPASIAAGPTHRDDRETSPRGPDGASLPQIRILVNRIFSTSGIDRPVV